ncbi:hypothetical protein H0B56_18090 [Haloechinothrix sp. YIM 98757]|uniref:Uncharacterized protein n=1 Tax=Haloechinothrix aidingensis TaxID=2752311 RepID=A0A838AE18_9PSEU|nr:hypothetical protein [Haloechinothrix aidingensis]MBA0127460.1 hypothetical protein [Haloechinothrix aidingensis]
MTVRAHTAAAPVSGDARNERGLAVRPAIDALLDPATRPRQWPRDIPAGRLAVVRGFDRGSREFRAAVRDAAHSWEWPVLDVAGTPAFGAVPDGHDVRLVVAQRAAQLPLARRCAARWAALLLGPDCPPADPTSLVARPVPALSVRSAREGGTVYDSVATRLSVSGPVGCHVSGAAREITTALAVEPTAAGILVESSPQADTSSLRIATRQVDFRLEEPAEATLDDHPQLLAPGDYTVSLHAGAYHRLVPGPG